MKEVPHHNHFIVKGGSRIRSLKELASVLEAMDDDTFKHHVNSERNDFYNWLVEVIGDACLADLIKGITSREDMIRVIKEALRQSGQEKDSGLQEEWKELSSLLEDEGEDKAKTTMEAEYIKDSAKKSHEAQKEELPEEQIALKKAGTVSGSEAKEPGTVSAVKDYPSNKLEKEGQEKNEEEIENEPVPQDEAPKPDENPSNLEDDSIMTEEQYQLKKNPWAEQIRKARLKALGKSEEESTAAKKTEDAEKPEPKAKEKPKEKTAEKAPGSGVAPTVNKAEEKGPAPQQKKQEPEEIKEDSEPNIQKEDTDKEKESISSDFESYEDAEEIIRPVSPFEDNKDSHEDRKPKASHPVIRSGIIELTAGIAAGIILGLLISIFL